jgi:hypothetical protein
MFSMRDIRGDIDGCDRCVGCHDHERMKEWGRTWLVYHKGKGAMMQGDAYLYTCGV